MKFAVWDRRSRRILSLHRSVEEAEGRFRHYITGAIDGNVRRYCPWLPPGTGALGLVATLRIVRVDATAERGHVYAGKVYRAYKRSVAGSVERASVKVAG